MVSGSSILGFVALHMGLTRGQSTPEFVDFRITDYAKFTCAAMGFKCGYFKDDYESYKMTVGSMDSVGSLGGESNNVWGNVGSVNDTLTLIGCQVDYCFVRCNYGCSCVLEDGNTTCQAGTAPPTAAPPSEPPQVCPVTKNTQLCPQMALVAPPGTTYDCYNFCGNNFQSACAFGESCAGVTCSNVGADGTVQGLIIGCTQNDLKGVTADGSSTGATSGARDIMTKQTVGFALAVSALVLGL